jgi:hypothetical protein
MNQKVVYDSFGSLNELLKAYIDKKDYWKRFFELYSLPDGATAAQVKELFIQLMQDNLKHFSGSGEMQNLVLWQVSERSPLLRMISEKREVEGAKLLGKAERFFEGSGISFSAVVSLLLGGSYYAVLHARTNKSSVAGIDVGQEKHWRMMQRTIAQVIGWAWDAAAQKTNNQTKPTIKHMNFELIYLEDLAGEAAAARGKGDLETDPDERLVKEARKVERAMLSHMLNAQNESQIKIYLRINLYTLVAICNQLYDPARTYNPDAEVVLRLLEAIRMHVGSLIPGTLALPRIFSDRENLKFAEQWAGMSKRMLEKGVAQRLVTLAGMPFERFATQGDKLEWHDFRYLRRYAAVLASASQRSDLNSLVVMDALMGLDFNDTAFMRYCVELLEDGIRDSGETGARQMLSRRKTTIRQVMVLSNMRYHPFEKPLREGLMDWIDAELEYYGQGLST